MEPIFVSSRRLDTYKELDDLIYDIEQGDIFPEVEEWINVPENSDATGDEDYPMMATYLQIQVGYKNLGILVLTSLKEFCHTS